MTLSFIKTPHLLSQKQILAELRSSAFGLTSREAQKRLQLVGPNELPSPREMNPFILFLTQFTSTLVLLLVAAIIISLFVGQFIDAMVIAIIVLLNGILGFIQEYNAQKSLQALAKLIPQQAKVLRDQKLLSLHPRELVPGDVILVETGDKVPADARLIEIQELAALEAVLTGESTPVVKKTSAIADTNIIAEQHNMIFSSTTITAGKGKALVTTTGKHTQLGNIASLLRETKKEPTPLQEKLTRLSKYLTILTVFIAILIFGLGLAMHKDVFVMFMTALAISVAAIPEGLPSVITIAMATGVKRMVKRHALVRKLALVETLGSVNVICTDKTGTLTMNEMTVTKMWTNGKEYSVTGSGYEPMGSFLMNNETIKPAAYPFLLQLLKAGYLCNNTIINRAVNTKEDIKGDIKTDAQMNIQKNLKTNDDITNIDINAKIYAGSAGHEIIGDPSEAALLVSAAKAGLSVVSPRIKEIPFTSERKMMTTLHREKHQVVSYSKGAPDIILTKCNRIVFEGKIVSFTPSLKKKVSQQNNHFASLGLRVLAFAYKQDSAAAQAEKDLIFLGLQAMTDPPRAEVKQSIEKCQKAGIRVIMITGDHLETAKAIAKNLHIPGKAIEGKDLSTINLSRQINKISIFARVNPEHKLLIVEALQKKGHCVAMTGDGVNDAPALKKADIGVAMGASGTDTAREAGEMILLDDNFSSIVSAIEEGRGIYENIRKFFAFLFSGNIGEVGILALTLALNLPLPLTPLMILFINLVSDGLPALALSIDPFEPDAMKNQPRKINEPLWKGLAPYLIVYPLLMVVAVTAVFWWQLANGMALAKAQTAAFVLVVFFELFQAFSARSVNVPALQVGIFKNKFLIIAAGISLLLTLGLVYLPSLQTIFSTASLTLREIGALAGIACIGFVYLEIHKFISSRLRSAAKSYR